MMARPFAAFIMVALALLLLVSASEDASAVSYKSRHYVTLSCAGDDRIDSTADDSCTPGTEYSPDVTADIEAYFWIDSSSDGAPHKHSNFAEIIQFAAPSEWRFARGNTIFDGALSAKVAMVTTLSVLDGSCTYAVPILIPLFDATTDRSQSVNWVGDGDNLLADSNGDTTPDYIDRYPTYLHIYDVPESALAPSLKPMARYAGHIHVTPGAPATKLEYLVFDPWWSNEGAWGHQMIMVMDNPWSWESPPAPSTITEFCEPLSLLTIFYGKTQGMGQLYSGPMGMEFDVPDGPLPQPDWRCATDPGNPLCGYVRSTNPADNSGLYSGDTHVFSVYNESYRDADCDGIPNSEDGCPVHGINDGCPPEGPGAPDPETNCDDNYDDDGDTYVNDGCPQIGAGSESGTECYNSCDDDPTNDGSLTDSDVDGDTIADPDGIEDVCDPTLEKTNFGDHDLDGYFNREDNCPLVYNPNQADGDWRLDFGPGDNIGDACDPDPLHASTEGTFLVDYVRDAVCLDTDTDADGWCDADEASLGSVASTAPEGSAEAGPTKCNDSTDNDYDGFSDAADAGCSTPENTVLDPPGLDPVPPGICSNQTYYVTTGDPAAAGSAINDDQDWVAIHGGYAEDDPDNPCTGGTPDCGTAAACTNVVNDDPNDPTTGADTTVNDGCELANNDPECTCPDGDYDCDGVDDGSDNCIMNYNPEQLNTDGDFLGDACDSDDDNDGMGDYVEFLYGGVPKDVFHYGQSGIAMDMNGDTKINMVDVYFYKGNVGNKPTTEPGWSP